jgi:hypothetical protein
MDVKRFPSEVVPIRVTSVNSAHKEKEKAAHNLDFGGAQQTPKPCSRLLLRKNKPFTSAIALTSICSKER